MKRSNKIIIGILLFITIIAIIIYSTTEHFSLSTGATLPATPGIIRENGTDSLGKPLWEFSPEPNYFGPVSVRYTLTDDSAGTIRTYTNRLLINIKQILDQPTTTTTTISSITGGNGFYTLTGAELFNRMNLTGGEINQNYDKIRIETMSSGTLKVNGTTLTLPAVVPINDTIRYENSSLVPVPVSITFSFIDSTYIGKLIGDGTTNTYAPTGPFELNFTYNPCPSGFYCSNASTGIECPAGSYCLQGSISPVQCPAGSYCLARSTAPTPCTAGNYCPPGTISEQPCPGGMYCPNPSTSLSCPAGFYCPGSTVNPISCTSGNYCSGSNIVPFTCPAGRVCSTTANTGLCPLNYYCPGGTNPIACPVGKATKDPGSTKSSDCTVICTELHRRGFLSDEIMEADALFGKNLSEETYNNYRYWADTVVVLMKRNSITGSITLQVAKFIGVPWAYAMAEEMKVPGIKSSMFGRFVLRYGIKASNFIVNHVKAFRGH